MSEVKKYLSGKQGKIDLIKGDKLNKRHVLGLNAMIFFENNIR